MSKKKAVGPRGVRNRLVEAAVLKALTRIDDFIAGEKIALPKPAYRRACDEMIGDVSAAVRGRSSVRSAALFFTFYLIEDPSWDLDALPIGTRGKFGDKRLGEGLSQRSLTLHGTTTAFGENLGWKGNVRAGNVHLKLDGRFNAFLAAIADAVPDERCRIADYMAQRFAASRYEIPPVPPVGADVLTFVRAKELLYRLIDLPSEGHIQQFLIAALLHVYRRRAGVEVRTHHPHAADKFDNTAGDIEEFREDVVIRAYEVTVRDDWQNRISNFKEKMDRFSLSKYIIIARGINDDPEWSEPARLALKLEPYGRDIAVLDIQDVVNFLAAELSPGELQDAMNRGYAFLSSQKLSGRREFVEKYWAAVNTWLDAIEGEQISF